MRISWLAEEPFAPQEGLCSMDLVSFTKKESHNVSRHAFLPHNPNSPLPSVTLNIAPHGSYLGKLHFAGCASRSTHCSKKSEAGAGSMEGLPHVSDIQETLTVWHSNLNCRVDPHKTPPPEQLWTLTESSRPATGSRWADKIVTDISIHLNSECPNILNILRCTKISKHT
jgi:hypothetical protein